jgi:hypothetical protein
MASSPEHYDEGEGIETLRGASPPPPPVLLERRTSGIGSSRQPPTVITRATSPPRRSDNDNDNDDSHASHASAATSPANNTTIHMTQSSNTNTQSSASNQPSASASNQPQWECDYDKAPTDLYQAIEAREWDFILGMFSFNVSDVAAASVKRQCSTWIVRKETNGKLRWRLLPLHAACIFQAPSMIIELLLQESPQSAAAKDDQGMLPLHLAFRQQPMNFTVIEELMTAYPAAVTVKDRRGRTPLQAVSITPTAASVVKGEDGRQHAVASAGAPAAVISLFSQIHLAAAKQEWAAGRDKDMEQRLQSVAEQHASRWTEIRTDFSQQVEDMKATIAALELEKGQLLFHQGAERKAHENVLYITQEQLIKAQAELREAQDELIVAQDGLREAREAPPVVVAAPPPVPPTPPVPVPTPSVSAVAMSLPKLLPTSPPGMSHMERTQLSELVQTLLEQQSRLTLQLDTMSKKLQGKRDLRSSLLQHLGAIDIRDEIEDPVPDLKVKLEATHLVVSDRLASIMSKHTTVEETKDLASAYQAMAMDHDYHTAVKGNAKTVDEKDREARTRIPNFGTDTFTAKDRVALAAHIPKFAGVVEEKKENESEATPGTDQKAESVMIGNVTLPLGEEVSGLGRATDTTVVPASPKERVQVPITPVTVRKPDSDSNSIMDRVSLTRSGDASFLAIETTVAPPATP